MMTSRHFFPSIKLTLLLIGLSLWTSGCDNTQNHNPDSRSLQPNDANMAALYQRSCFACHATAASNAPLTGDAQAWAPRMAQGMDTLINHVVDGYKGMPPMGLCMDCNSDDFEKLILFMAQQESN